MKLPQVTIVCVDSVNYSEAINAFHKSIEKIEFSKALFFSDVKLEVKAENITIPKIRSTEEYSHFIFKELNQYITTDFVLIIQYDGYVLNPECWEESFLDYDYIGARWSYRDSFNVGNGGFSLRSKRLLEELSLPKYQKIHPEDHHICRTYGKALKDKGFKFAPEEVSERFSFEIRRSRCKTFGFHGWRNLIIK
jgi:hypothetical protein